MSSWSTALKSPYCFVNFWVCIIGSDILFFTFF
jgi:hypothetical protein